MAVRRPCPRRPPPVRAGPWRTCGAGSRGGSPCARCGCAGHARGDRHQCVLARGAPAGPVRGGGLAVRAVRVRRPCPRRPAPVRAGPWRTCHACGAGLRTGGRLAVRARCGGRPPSPRRPAPVGRGVRQPVPAPGGVRRGRRARGGPGRAACLRWAGSCGVPVVGRDASGGVPSACGGLAGVCRRRVAGLCRGAVERHVPSPPCAAPGQGAVRLVVPRWCGVRRRSWSVRAAVGAASAQQLLKRTCSSSAASARAWMPGSHSVSSRSV